MRFRFICCLLIPTLLNLVGCRQEKRPDGLPELHPAEVTVIQDGKPLAGALVRLVSDSNDLKWSCGGATDENGVAVLKTIGEFHGVPAGKYKVLISKLEIPPTSGTDLSNLNSKPAANSTGTANLVDLKFSSPASTPLELTVEKGRSKQSFDVGAAVRVLQTFPK
ncbi:carboxypeptidase regulatory-like domain-containing protein [Planctomicrobium sp. SH668]|uniref:carboxypeptidase regulatory-like domain-containing protein n=1 Tax=Planctomicrobium sp. SH668 TaxID=3448126 RepID=UPI003F5C7C00